MSALRWVDGHLLPEPAPTPEQVAWRRTSGAASVLAAVERRLVAAGAVIELRQLQGLSAQEQDVLVWLEREDQRSTEEPTDERGTVAA